MRARAKSESDDAVALGAGLALGTEFVLGTGDGIRDCALAPADRAHRKNAKIHKYLDIVPLFILKRC